MKIIKKTIFSTSLMLVFLSCKNYYIPKDSFINQFSGVDSTNSRTVTVVGPMGTISEYKANSINVIKCIDKNGAESSLNNGPSIETRFTINDKKRIVFYFDRIMVKDSIVYGIQSRFMGLRASIPLKDITKIEVQDGHKNFRYIKVDPPR